MLVTKKTMDDSSTYYSAITNVQYTLFKKTDLTYFYEAAYKDDALQKAYFIHKKNDEVEEEAKLVWSKDGYNSTNPAQHQQYKEAIHKSMLKAYFEKPQHREELFSERFHEMVKVGSTDEGHKFIFFLPNGDKNVYEYNDKGICKKITASAGFMDFEMHLVE